MNRERKEFRRRLHQVINLRNLLDEAIESAIIYAPTSVQTELRAIRRLADEVCASETGFIL